MARYFFEVAYKGTKYAGFQIQENAVTIQSCLEDALNTIHGFAGLKPTPAEQSLFRLTGSSRTDAGVHAHQNFFHADVDHPLHLQAGYKVNAILPRDIVLKRILSVPDGAHCRFDAASRAYRYSIHQGKNPFAEGLSYYYPYKLNVELLQACADAVLHAQDFAAFAKTSSDAKTTRCHILESRWEQDGSKLHYHIKGNRFLRGMVRLLTATQLKVARQKISLQQFQDMLTGEGKAVHAAPAAGLTLMQVSFPEVYFEKAEVVFTSL